MRKEGRVLPAGRAAKLSKEQVRILDERRETQRCGVDARCWLVCSSNGQVVVCCGSNLTLSLLNLRTLILMIMISSAEQVDCF